MTKRYLYLTVFISGMTSLAVELSASRLLGNVFGTSNIVWANVIGLMLLYLTIGYFIGGRWADRSPYPVTLYKIIMWAGFLSAIIPLIARPILHTAAGAVIGAEAALALGSFVSVIVLFSVPVTLLGCVSPFAVRLAIDDPQSAGQISGQIYGISTLGSLVGTFLPVLILIPQLGTTRTFLVFAFALYIVGFIGYGQSQSWRSAVKWLWMVVVVILLAIWALNGPLRSPVEGSTLLYETESAYNFIQVVENERGFRDLLLNEGQGVHSRYHSEYVFFGGTWELFLSAPYFNEPPFTPDDVNSLLVIGLAAGTIPRQYIDVYGDIPIDGVEIDPKIIQVGAEYFGMNAEQMPSLRTFAQDGRYILRELDRSYSVIAIDAYRPPYIPWHLTTVEFFQEVRALLEDDGVVAINVGRTSTDRRLVDAMGQTLKAVYPSVYVIDVPYSYNTIIVATNQPTEPDYLAQNLSHLPDHQIALRSILNMANTSLVDLGESETQFLDDRAPIETLVDSLVLNVLLYENLDEFR
jgi:spermidine synthase